MGLTPKSLPLKLAFPAGVCQALGVRNTLNEGHQMIQKDIDRLIIWRRETSSFYSAKTLSTILSDENMLWRVVESWEVGFYGLPASNVDREYTVEEIAQLRKTQEKPPPLGESNSRRILSWLHRDKDVYSPAQLTKILGDEPAMWVSIERWEAEKTISAPIGRTPKRWDWVDTRDTFYLGIYSLFIIFTVSVVVYAWVEVLGGR